MVVQFNKCGPQISLTRNLFQLQMDSVLRGIWSRICQKIMKSTPEAHQKTLMQKLNWMKKWNINKYKAIRTLKGFFDHKNRLCSFSFWGLSLCLSEPSVQTHPERQEQVALFICFWYINITLWKNIEMRSIDFDLLNNTWTSEIQQFKIKSISLLSRPLWKRPSAVSGLMHLFLSY